MDQDVPRDTGRGARPALTAAGVAVVAVGYTAAVLTGVIARDNRIDLAHLALIGIAVVVVLLVAHPELPARVRAFKLGALEVELEQVNKEVRDTKHDVAFLRMLLPLLLPESEQQHLVNLRYGRTAGYVGRPELRSELRRLRYLKLISVRGYVEDLRDGKEFDLGGCAALTDRGSALVEQIERMRAEAEPAPDRV